MVNVAFLTLGCPKNEADTARMAGRIQASTYELVDTPEDADVVIVNTCAFIQSAAEESIEEILSVAHNWLPEKPGRHLLVAGCLPSRYGEELAEELPEASALLSVCDEQNVCDLIEQLTGEPAFERGEAGQVVDAPSCVFAPYAYLKIADGCDRTCSYCTIPTIRGPYRSTPLDQLITQAQGLIAQDVKEIILIAQDTTRYGFDLEGTTRLPDVIRAIAPLPGLDRLRVMYLQPDGVDDTLLKAIAECPTVVNSLEMPLQHSARRILKSMQRSGDGTSFRELIARIRSVLPGVTLRTTLIAGYPGETEEEFSDLLSFVEDVQFDFVGVFPFSPEEGTLASTLPHQLTQDVRIARAQEVRDLADDIGWSKAASHVGEIIDVLLEGTDADGKLYGRASFQAPDIDGVVTVSIPEGTLVEIGTIVPVRIIDSVLYDLEGELA